MLVSFPLPQTQRSNGPESTLRVEHLGPLSSDESTALVTRQKVAKAWPNPGVGVHRLYTGPLPWWDGAPFWKGVPQRGRDGGV